MKKFLRVTFILLLIVLHVNALMAFALPIFNTNPVHADGHQTDLQKMVGYYQHSQMKEMYIKISVKDNKLWLTQEWDFKEIPFTQKSVLEFFNDELNFPLVFNKDDNGEINQFLAFGKDIWIKDNNYLPEKARDLNDAEKKQLQSLLDGMAERLIDLVNNYAVDKVDAFLKENGSNSFRESLSMDFKNRIQMAHRLAGELDLGGMTDFKPKAAMANYQAKGKLFDNAWEFNLRLDNDNKLKLFNSRVITDKHLPAPKDEQELTMALEKLLSILQKKDLFSGTVLLAKGDRILFQDACGYAVKELQIKNNLNTQINVGSMNKMFTATGIMQLVEKGKIGLDDPISKYLGTEWLSQQTGDRITVHHLLTHTSGLGDFFSEDFDRMPASQFATLNAYKPFVKDTLAFEPGTDWQYSNTGMLLLGAIIEKVSGMNYVEYCKTYIYRPSGMVNTNVYYDYEGNKSDHVALGYLFKPNGEYESNAKSSFTRGSSAGGAYSTVDDLYHFSRTLISGKLVSAASLTKMFTDYTKNGYGYGFQLWGSKENPVIGHSGGAPGISAVEYILPNSGYTAVVLSNYDMGSYYLGEFILNGLKTITQADVPSKHP